MTTLYGHRGAKGVAPENTLASFQACLDAGVTRCELDLRLSRDEQPIVIHDADLKRLAGQKARVKDCTAAKLAGYDVRHAGPAWPQPCPVPTLAEVFAACPFEHWQLEIKSLSRKRAVILIQAIAHLCEHYGLNDKVVLTSSSHTVLRAAMQQAPHLQRGLVAEYAWLDPVRTAQRFQCSMLAMNWSLCIEKRIREAQAAGLHVSAWTVNDPALMRQLVHYGVDSLITDFPGLASATLGSR